VDEEIKQTKVMMSSKQTLKRRNVVLAKIKITSVTHEGTDGRRGGKCPDSRTPQRIVKHTISLSEARMHTCALFYKCSTLQKSTHEGYLCSKSGFVLVDIGAYAVGTAEVRPAHT
jgi:hypothetical protein